MANNKMTCCHPSFYAARPWGSTGFTSSDVFDLLGFFFFFFFYGRRKCVQQPATGHQFLPDEHRTLDRLVLVGHWRNGRRDRFYFPSSISCSSKCSVSHLSSIAFWCNIHQKEDYPDGFGSYFLFQTKFYSSLLSWHCNEGKISGLFPSNFATETFDWRCRGLCRCHHSPPIVSSTGSLQIKIKRRWDGWLGCVDQVLHLTFSSSSHRFRLCRFLSSSFPSSSDGALGRDWLVSFVFVHLHFSFRFCTPEPSPSSLSLWGGRLIKKKKEEEEPGERDGW